MGCLSSIKTFFINLLKSIGVFFGSIAGFASAISIFTSNGIVRILMIISAVLTIFCTIRILLSIKPEQKKTIGNMMGVLLICTLLGGHIRSLQEENRDDIVNADAQPSIVSENTESGEQITAKIDQLKQDLFAAPDEPAGLYEVFDGLRSDIHSIPLESRELIDNETIERYNYLYGIYVDYWIVIENEKIANTPVMLSATGTKYHQEYGCRTLKYQGTMSTVKGAHFAGYGACNVCHPQVYGEHTPPEIKYDDYGIIWN